MNKKKTFEKRERKRIKTLIGPLSLSLQTKCKWNCKANTLCFHICPGSSKNNLYKIGHGLICYIWKYAKQNYMSYSLPIFKMHLNCFQIVRPVWWLSYTLNQLSKYIYFIKCGVGMIPQVVVLPNVLLLGIFMPLIKIQTKYFNHPEQRVCWACISNKLRSEERRVGKECRL